MIGHIGNSGTFMLPILQLHRTPDDGCNTYEVTMRTLQEFEEDLHRHIHLENNILFPGALKLEEELGA